MPRDADSLLITEKWSSSGNVATPASAGLTFADGWTAAYSQPGSTGPNREVVNWFFRVFSALLLDVNAHGGGLPWDDGVDYTHPAIVTGSDNLVYLSVQDSTNVDPTTDADDSHWTTFGDTPDASETVKGLIEIATDAESIAGTETDLAVPPSGVAAALLAHKRVLWLPAAGGVSPETNGASDESGGDANFAYTAKGFVDTADSHLDFMVPMPSTYQSTSLTWRFYWTAASGSGTVNFAVSVASPGDNVALSGLTNVGNVSDTLQTAGRLHVTDALTQSTAKPVAGDLLMARITRDVSADTLAATAHLLAARVEW